MTDHGDNCGNLPDIRVGDIVRKRTGHVTFEVTSLERQAGGHIAARLLNRRTGIESGEDVPTDGLSVLFRSSQQTPTNGVALSEPVPTFNDAMEQIAHDWYADNATADDLERLGWRVAWLTGAGEQLIVAERERVVIADAGLSLDAVARLLLRDLDSGGHYLGRSA